MACFSTIQNLRTPRTLQPLLFEMYTIISNLYKGSIVLVCSVLYNIIMYSNFSVVILEDQNHENMIMGNGGGDDESEENMLTSDKEDEIDDNVR